MTTDTQPGRLITLVRRTARPACLMLPGTGGGFQPYVGLAASWGETHDVYAVRASGLVPGEEPDETIEAMADSALVVMDQAGIVPEVVFGWSLGGAMAWEVGVRLADRGAMPDLVLVDSSPLPRRSTVAADEQLCQTIVRMLGPRPDGQTRERVLRTCQTQLAALARYRAQRPYGGRVLMLSCTDGDVSTRAEWASRWRALAPRLCEGQLDSDHFAVFEAGRLPQLVDEITAFLAAVREPAPC